MHILFYEVFMTQQACVITNLSLEFATHSLFNSFDFALFAGKKTALIGRNGQGKSLIMQILHLQHQHSLHYSGQIHWQMPHAYLSQFSRLIYNNDTTIAQVLEIESLFKAIQRVESGKGSFKDYDDLEHHWHLPQLWEKQLTEANLPTDLNFKIHHLSEGQKTKLALCHLLLKKDHFLLLDEPSNHLDADSRQWLINQIHQHPSGLLIISHDRILLQEMDHIYALSDKGLQHIEGNYSDYEDFIQTKIRALDQKIDQHKRDIKSMQVQQHQQILKMQKRSEQAKKLRLTGSQPKMVLNAKRSQAERSLANIQKQQNRQHIQLKDDLSKYQSDREIIRAQQFQFQQHSIRDGEILRLKQVVLPFGVQTPIDFSLTANQKIHLHGQNGSGKSTLMNLIRSLQQQKDEYDSNQFFLNANIAYLEQNLNILDPQLNAVENLHHFNEDLTSTEWRTLLGQLRIRGDLSTLAVEKLSGGEKIKIILLGLSHAQSPFNLLLLDEPENHLDIDSRDILASAIQKFKGAVILVSHDQTFVDRCGIQEQFLISS